MNIGKIFGAIGAGLLGAGAIVLAGRTGVGKTEESGEPATEPAKDDATETAAEPVDEIVCEEVTAEDTPAEE